VGSPLGDFGADLRIFLPDLRCCGRRNSTNRASAVNSLVNSRPFGGLLTCEPEPRRTRVPACFCDWSGKRGSNPRHPPWQGGAALRDVPGRLGINDLSPGRKCPEASRSVLKTPIELSLTRPPLVYHAPAIVGYFRHRRTRPVWPLDTRYLFFSRKGERVVGTLCSGRKQQMLAHVDHGFLTRCRFNRVRLAAFGLVATGAVMPSERLRRPTA
jgi:hypothetical protein